MQRLGGAHRRWTSLAARLSLVLALLMGSAASSVAADLAEARRLYNLGRYEAAIDLASAAAQDPETRHAALVVLGRSCLERFRQTASAADLTRAREALRDVDASRLEARDRVELLIGLGEALYLDDLFLAAAELFESALDEAGVLGPGARDQLLDWWATALDRHAQARGPAERAVLYARIDERMHQELLAHFGTSAAVYWAALSARAAGDVDRAWDLSRVGWVRAQLTPDRGAALRPDLDRLVREAIVPERARRIQEAGGDVAQATAGMLAEWEAFMGKWNR